MRKLTFVLIIAVVAVLGAALIFPNVKTSLTSFFGSFGLSLGVWSNAIYSSPLFQSYGYYIVIISTVIVVSLLWNLGHGLFNRVRRTFVRSAVRETEVMTRPDLSPQVRVQPVAQTIPTKQVTTTPAPPPSAPKVEEK